MAKRNNNTEAKIVNFDEAQKAVKEATVSESVKDEKIVSSVVEIKEEPQERMTMEDLVDYCQKNNPDVQNLINLFKEKNLINTDYITHQELSVMAEHIIDTTCFDEEGHFRQDTFSETVYEIVLNFYLFTRINFGKLSYIDSYDAIRKYKLMEVAMMLHKEQVGELRKYCASYINDIKTNEYSMEALVSQLIRVFADLGASINEALSNPEVLSKIANAPNV